MTWKWKFDPIYRLFDALKQWILDYAESLVSRYLGQNPIPIPHIPRQIDSFMERAACASAFIFQIFVLIILTAWRMHNCFQLSHATLSHMKRFPFWAWNTSTFVKNVSSWSQRRLKRRLKRMIAFWSSLCIHCIRNWEQVQVKAKFFKNSPIATRTTHPFHRHHSYNVAFIRMRFLTANKNCEKAKRMCRWVRRRLKLF